MMHPDLQRTLGEQIAVFEKYHTDRDIIGGTRLFSFNPETGEIKTICEQHNDVMHEGADILAQLSAGNVNHKLAAMYMEFENGTHPAPITKPAVDRADGVSYYLGLSDTPDRDFLRVPMVIAPNIISSDEALYKGNQVNFFAVSEGAAGFHSRTFDASVASAVFGLAVAATPDPGEATKDLVYARSYVNVGQVPKEDNFQVGAQWFTRFN
jgi:hypothetical protein